MLCDVICVYEIPLPSLYCGICEVHICKACEKKHLQGESKLHEIVSFKNREIILKCQINPQKFVKFIVNNVISKLSFSVRFLKSSKDIKFMLWQKMETQKKKILQRELQEFLQYCIFDNVKHLTFIVDKCFISKFSSFIKQM